MAARKLKKALAFQENLLYTAVIVNTGWNYRGRVITVEDVGFIRGLISRSQLRKWLDQHTVKPSPLSRFRGNAHAGEVREDEVSGRLSA